MKPVTFGSYEIAASGAPTDEAKINACSRMETITRIFCIMPMVSCSSRGAGSTNDRQDSIPAACRLISRSRVGSRATKTGVRPCFWLT